MATEELSWRKTIVSQLQERNRVQGSYFHNIIAQNNKLFEQANALRSENLQLSLQNERLKVELPITGSGTSGPDIKTVEKIQHLEQKLLRQQEELTELHRRRGENAQQIIDLNAKLQEMEILLSNKQISLDAEVTKNATLRAEVLMYQNNLKEMDNLNQLLRDEHQALQLAFASLEDQLRKVQDENRQMVERLIAYKAKDVAKMNEENDNFLNSSNPSRPLSSLTLSTFGLFRRRNAKMQKELEEACKDASRGKSPDDIREGSGPFFHSSSVPTSAYVKFDAHEGEVNAVKWSPVDRILATGGADRKVKLWDVSKGTAENRGILQGSNAGVMSVDFDMTGTLLLGASNDYATRVWNVADQRLKHTFTGHSGKVMSAKFLGDPSKVVTGSHDRTLKIWDLKSRSCIETKFAGSSCNDLVTADGAGSTIISGHYDKRIRLWDSRTDSSANEIILNGKVTSLDLSRDCNYLVTCVRDDTLPLLDLRKNQVVLTFSCEGFKVGCDWARATFSPDGQYVAVGSADGSVFVWSVATAKVETVLKEHGSATTATAWSPYGGYLATVDRSKRAIVWSDH